MTPQSSDLPADEVLATIQASPPRRWFGIVVMALLGFILLWIAITQPPAPLGQVFLIFMGALATWGADRMRRATALRIDLTRDRLVDSEGTVLAEIANVRKVERGLFAMKPSNGFLLRLETTRGRHWRPGLWWSVGKRVGVGGVTSAAQTKATAQVIEMLLVERDAAKSD